MFVDDEWINKICNCIYNGILHSPQKEDAVTWIKLEDIMLSEICQLQKEKYMISLIWITQSSKNHRNRK